MPKPTPSRLFRGLKSIDQRPEKFKNIGPARTNTNWFQNYDHLDSTVLKAFAAKNFDFFSGSGEWIPGRSFLFWKLIFPNFTLPLVVVLIKSILSVYVHFSSTDSGTYLVFLNECERCVVLNQIKVRLESPADLVSRWFGINIEILGFWNLMDLDRLPTIVVFVIVHARDDSARANYVWYNLAKYVTVNPAKVVPPFQPIGKRLRTITWPC